MHLNVREISLGVSRKKILSRVDLISKYWYWYQYRSFSGQVLFFLFVSQHIFSTFLCQDLKLNNLFMFWCNIFYTHSRPYGTVAGTGSSPPKTLNWISRSKWTDAYFTVQTSLFGGRLCLFQQDNATQFTILQVLLHRRFTVKVWVLRWPTLLESNKDELSFVAV